MKNGQDMERARLLLEEAQEKSKAAFVKQMNTMMFDALHEMSRSLPESERQEWSYFMLELNKSFAKYCI
jgi:hypothetical protein